MKRIWIVIAVVLCGCLAGSCEQQETEKYEGDARLYFHRSTEWEGQLDSVRHSFFLVPEGKERDTVLVDVRTMGFPVGTARPVKIVQTNAGKPGAAVAGVHYVGFDDVSLKEALVVQPHAIKVMVPVILLHDPSLDKGKVRIEMEVVGNEYFKPGIDKNCRFMVQTTALAEKPGTWDKNWVYYFGEWGTEKMGFIVNYLGFTEFEKTDQESGYKEYLKLKANEKLEIYNKAHPEYPLCEDKDKKHEGGVKCVNCVVFL